MDFQLWKITARDQQPMTPQLICFPSPTKARLALRSHSRLYFNYIGKAIVCCSILKYRILSYGYIII